MAKNPTIWPFYQQQQKRGGRRGEANETEEEKKNDCERASYSFRASRKMPRSSRLAHKAPVMQASPQSSLALPQRLVFR